MEYTFAELTDMLLVYGEARCNSREAERIYRRKFPNRRHPSRKIFPNIERRIRETGTLSVTRPDVAPRRTARTVAAEEEILERVENAPFVSTREIANAMRIGHSSVWRILHEQLLHPYHLQKVHALIPADYPLRVFFCQWYLRSLINNPQFNRNILFSDEALFTRNGYFNSHNYHVWHEENPHATHVTGHQQRFHLNIWAGIVADQLIGPFVLPPRLNGDVYLDFLRNTLPGLLEEVPLNIRQQMIFQHDGAPAHFYREVRNYLDEAYPGRWIGRGGPIAWPPRSPDLTSLDFFLWGYLKNLVYATPVETVEQLQQRIFDSCRTIQNTAGIFERVRQSMVRRCNACIEAGGCQFEHLL